MRALCLSLLLVLLGLSLIGEIPWRRFANSNPTLDLQRQAGADAQSRPLFILIHGYDPRETRLQGTADVLRTQGDVLRVDYPARLPSNADPDAICAALDAALEAKLEGLAYTDIRFVAHSSGALLARRTLLLGWARHRAWASRVTRVVLLAGMNRGWSVAGIRPLDMPTGKRMAWRLGEWLGRLTGFGSFILDMKAGSPFVANLRLDWMSEMHRRESAPDARPLEVVQMLGDIDDVVSLEDNEDLRVMASSRYALIRVRGTGHGTIIDFADPTLGEYRRDKLLLAATQPFDRVAAENEEQPFSTNRHVKSVVFVLHGIRDLGEWSSRFETAIRATHGDDVEIVSPRYGYLGMGPFLLPKVRDRYVRWFMDEYTETLARYPDVDAQHIQFFGHSNGTYLLADALKDYRAMRIDRIVFAGSVVPRNYDWQARIEAGQVNRVRNYVATSDWVVALFPRLFELKPFTLLDNDLGSAGFKGFVTARPPCAPDPERGSVQLPPVENVCFISGEHSAFDKTERIQEIVDFLVTDSPKPAVTEPREGLVPMLLGLQLTVWMTWLAIVALIAYVGVRAVSSAPSPTWVALVLFILLVVRTLQTV
jgi:alpha-beta hydrolase superfamily lysophospholipase